MNTKVDLFIKPFLIGVGGLFFTFMIMDMAPPTTTSILSALLYLSLGAWVGRMQPQSLWYAPLLMNVLIWVVFIPMGIGIWYFLIPPLVALPAAYIGTYVGARSVSVSKNSLDVPEPAGERRVPTFQNLKSSATFVLLFLVGIACMFICLFLLFLATFSLGLSFGVGYALSYLLIYPLIAAAQGWRHPDQWLISAIVLCLAPSLYWFFVLWSDGKLHVSSISFGDSSVMLAVMPVAVALSCVAAFIVSRLKKYRRG